LAKDREWGLGSLTEFTLGNTCFQNRWVKESRLVRKKHLSETKKKKNNPMAVNMHVFCKKGETFKRRQHPT